MALLRGEKKAEDVVIVEIDETNNEDSQTSRVFFEAFSGAENNCFELVDGYSHCYVCLKKGGEGKLLGDKTSNKKRHVKDGELILEVKKESPEKKIETLCPTEYEEKIYYGIKIVVNP